MDWIKLNYPIVATCLIAAALAFYGYGCREQTNSLIDPSKEVGIEELQCEMDTLLARYDMRVQDLESQRKIKDIIFGTSISFMSTGTVDPNALIRDIAAAYGLLSGTQLAAKKYTARKKRKAAGETPVA